MAKRTYRREVMEQLFARSGNQCAFPGCTNKFYLDDVYVGQKCHVEATSEGGPRYNVKRIEDGTVDDESNLILLCPIHHKVVDSCPETFTPAALKDMKNKHEAEVARRMSGKEDGLEEFYTKLTLIFQKCNFDEMFLEQSFDTPFPEVYFEYLDNGYYAIRQLMKDDCAAKVSGNVRKELRGMADWIEYLAGGVAACYNSNGKGYAVPNNGRWLPQNTQGIEKYLQLIREVYQKYRFAEN